MPRISEKVKNYTTGRGAMNTKISVFDAIQEVMNTMFDIRCSTKKKWGYEWYDLARYGYYDDARKELMSKPACMAKTVAMQCVADLEYLREKSEKMERGDK